MQSLYHKFVKFQVSSPPTPSPTPVDYILIKCFINYIVYKILQSPCKWNDRTVNDVNSYFSNPVTVTTKSRRQSEAHTTEFVMPQQLPLNVVLVGLENPCSPTYSVPFPITRTI